MYFMDIRSYGLTNLILGKLLIFHLCLPGLTGRRLVVREVELINNCTDGLTADRDAYIVQGSAFLDPGFNKNTWPFINIELLRVTEHETEQTAIKCYIADSTHRPASTNGCYSTLVSEKHYNLVVRLIAAIKYSRGILFFRWYNRQRDQYLDSSNITLPGVYEENSEVITLTVNNDDNGNLTWDNCSFQLLQGNNSIELCCFNSPSPCVCKITYNGHSTLGTPCVNLVHMNLQSGIYTLSYSICNVESWKFYTCKDKALLDDTTVSQKPPIKIIHFGLRDYSLFILVVFSLGIVMCMGPAIFYFTIVHSEADEVQDIRTQPIIHKEALT